LRTLGSINSWFMRTRFQVNAQPTYILLDNDGTPLVAPRSYDTDVDSYIRFLRAGLEAYSK
jgi:hypothetical protein